MTHYKPTILCAVLCILGLHAMAQIDTDRPDFTESPNVVPAGALQIESGFIWENGEQEFCRSTETYRNITVNTTLFRYGLTDRFELRLNTNFLNQQVDVWLIPYNHSPCSLPDGYGNWAPDTLVNRSGFNPFFVGFKTNLFKSERISLGFLGHVYLPFAAGEVFGINHYTPEFLFPMSIGLTNKLDLAIQWSMRWDGETARSTTGYTLAFSYALSDKLKCYVEPYGYIVENSGENHRINGGFTYLVNNNFQLDLTGGAGLTESAPNSFIGCGFSVLLNKS